MVYRAWGVSRAETIRFLVSGFLINLILSLLIMYSLEHNGNGKTNLHEYYTEDREPSFSLTSQYLGYWTRVWEDVDESWPYRPSVFPEETACVLRVQTGFPLPAIQRRVDVPNPSPGFYVCPPWEGTLPFEIAACRPYWSGLLADTLLWGGLLYLIRGSFQTLRARRRVRRGCCPACGYDRSGLDSHTPCSECGVRIESPDR